MVGENVRSLEYLKHLAELVPGDDACECCRWAVEEIERLRGWRDAKAEILPKEGLMDVEAADG